MSEWYYARDNLPRGPVSGAEIQRMAASGDLAASDLVWKEGMTEWTRAGAARELYPDGMPSASREKAPRRSGYVDDDFDMRRRDFYPLRRGLSTGAKVGIILGIAGGVLAMTVIGIVLIVTLGRGAGSGSYTVNLNNGDIKREFIEFPGDGEVEVLVKSEVTPPGADVNLLILDDRTGQRLADDDSPSKDCAVRFQLSNATRCQIELENRGPGAARCFVIYKSKPRRR